MFNQTTFLLVFGLGAVCMLLGFFLVMRGVGAQDSESTIKLIGIEIRASRVGPGVLFALFGVVLIITAINKQPSEGGPAKTAEPARTEVAQTPAAPPPAAAAAPAAPAAATDASATVPEPPVETASAPMPAPNLDAARREREARLIRQFIGELANNGYCNDQILGPAPLMDCRTNVYALQLRLAAVGPVQNISFVQSGPSPVGLADRFMVTYAQGANTWTGVMGSDGKFLVLVTP